MGRSFPPFGPAFRRHTIVGRVARTRRRTNGAVRRPASARCRELSGPGSVCGGGSVEPSQPPQRAPARGAHPGRGGGPGRAHRLLHRRGRRRGEARGVHEALSPRRPRGRLPGVDLCGGRRQRRLRRLDPAGRSGLRGESGDRLPAGARRRARRAPRPSPQRRDVDPGSSRRRGHAQCALLRAEPLPDTQPRHRRLPADGGRPRRAPALPEPPRPAQHAVPDPDGDPGVRGQRAGAVRPPRSRASAGTSAR